MKKFFSTVAFGLLFFFPSVFVHAASVNCQFDTGERYSVADGAWQGSLSFETLWDLFPEGLSLDLKNSLLVKLDSQEIFNAGTTPKGVVYLMGSDMGIAGRMSVIKDGSILIYGGYCDVGFG